jgi:hypothetical protein
MYLPAFRSAPLLLWFSFLCAAADNPKPACTKQTLGQMWPAAANRDPVFRSKLSRCGELEVCVRGVWRYRWERLTVRLDQLHGASRIKKPAVCEAIAEPAGKSPEKADVASNARGN